MAKIKENPKNEPPPVEPLSAAAIKEKIKERGQTLQQLQQKIRQLQIEMGTTSDQINQTVGAIKQLQDLLPKNEKSVRN